MSKQNTLFEKRERRVKRIARKLKCRIPTLGTIVSLRCAKTQAYLSRHGLPCSQWIADLLPN
jgi:hypothetical protein